ncbi:hypothetical protein BN12_470002 [Nostocoides japonicum T1-X7]|uniref:Uncharacterized protein n=1 Tax=Nostocoides japonicum T1-X7 TaxID=1194083 RepID=A0A077M386_9MICO|nr:hypothetical protein BN12_470002 [Tetrasphaera japonica T1-X7]
MPDSASGSGYLDSARGVGVEVCNDAAVGSGYLDSGVFGRVEVCGGVAVGWGYLDSVSGVGGRGM